ncbi:MAG TPA: cyclic nucleotide-binding domain-containing protein [Beijerinckiaceae bacterium]|jgi:CRP-like cAMP-binding protein
MTLDEIVRTLSAVPLFSLLGEDVLRLVAFAGDVRAYATGELVFEKGQASDGGYVVIEGSVALLQDLDDPSTAVMVSAGALIGELALFAPTERPVAAAAATDARLLKISRGSFLRVLGEFPDSAAACRAALGARLDAMIGDLKVSEEGFSPD